jgi:hypothetical protein
MHHTPLTWYEQENQSYEAHLKFISGTAYLHLFLMKDGTQKTLCVSANGPHALAKTQQVSTFQFA